MSSIPVDIPNTPYLKLRTFVVNFELIFFFNKFKAGIPNGVHAGPLASTAQLQGSRKMLNYIKMEHVIKVVLDQYKKLSTLRVSSDIKQQVV